MWYNLDLRGFNFPLGYLYKLGVYTKKVTVSKNNLKILHEVNLPRLKSGASFIIPLVRVPVALYPLCIDIVHNP